MYLCICDDVPTDGCNYWNSFAAWNTWFGASDCINYGGTPGESGTSGCTDAIAINYNPNAIQDDNSVNTHRVVLTGTCITDQNHSIFITGDWTDINGNPLQEGAAIGVFFRDNNGDLKSAGWKTFTNGTVQIAAMGDDNSTSELDGLAAGEELEFRIWDPETCEEYPASVTSKQVLNPIFQMGSHLSVQ